MSPNQSDMKNHIATDQTPVTHVIVVNEVQLNTASSSADHFHQIFVMQICKITNLRRSDAEVTIQ